jgi:hypothetical protein
LKRIFFASLLVAVFIAACTSQQKVTSSWVNREAIPKDPYKSIFILTLTQNTRAKLTVEKELAKLISSRGRKAVKSSDIFTPKFLGKDSLTADKIVKAIKESGCDAVITLALLDVKTDTYYQPGTVYYPTAGYYGGYGYYYGHYSYVTYDPGYYATDKTYFIETNFYDVATDKHLWSIQSEAYNPTSLESWFSSYSHLILYQLRKEGLIKN